MNNRVAAALVVGWLICGLVAAGGINATYRYNACQRSFFPSQFDERRADRTLGFSLVLGFVGGPFVLVASALYTGAFTDGLSLSASPQCSDG